MEDEPLTPTDWQDYWDYQGNLQGSFAATKLVDSTIEVLGGYADILTFTESFKTLYPGLTKLLNQARVTKVTTSRMEVYYLLGWSYELGYFGFLMPTPSAHDASDLHPDHRLLLENFGGIIDWFGDLFDSNYFNQADNWEMANANIRDARQKEYYLNNRFYADTCKEKGVAPTLNLKSDFIQFTEEANGDFFFYHKENAEVWKFAHEGYNDILEEEFGVDIHLLQITGASESGFYKVKNCVFAQWVDRGAKAWLKAIKEMPFDPDNF